MSSEALCVAEGAHVQPPQSRGLQLPLSLFLSPNLPQEGAAEVRELALRRPQFARVVDDKEGALFVLPRFELEEVAALEKRHCRVVGLPFALRILRDPGVLAKVPALPLFDAIYREEGAVCCSALPQATRVRCMALARWMGARFSEDLEAEKVGLLVTARVSLHSESKYQAALKRKIPIVRPSYLEATWSAQAEVQMEPHKLSTFSGLSICFDPRQADIIEQYRDKVAFQGALIESLDRAEVVIAKDTFAKLYLEAKKMGILTASPEWLERCLQLRCCVPISGDLEVLNPKSLALVLHDAAQPLPEGEGHSGVGLMDCVLCLLYLEPGHLRDAAKYLAWRCGAFTTLNPLDKAITHVLFKSGAKVVQVSVAMDEDRVAFVDVSWLEACSHEGRRVREVAFPQQKVVYNPSCDEAYACALKRSGNLNGAMTPASQGTERSSRSTTAPASNATAPIPLTEQATGANGRAKAAGAWEQSQQQPQTNPLQQPPEQPLQPVEVQQPMQLQLQQPPQHQQQQPPQQPQPRGTHGIAAPVPLEIKATRPAERLPPTAEQGVFTGMVLGLVGWPDGDAEQLSLTDKMRSHGASVVRGGSSPEVVLEGQPDVCVCRDFGPPPFASIPRVATALATPLWVNACMADGSLHSRASYPHFEPGPGPLPLKEMASCTIRITALDAGSHRKRLRLEELVVALGAKVAQGNSSWKIISHVVCAVPDLLDKKMQEIASKRSVPVVTVQWLFECFRMHARQPEERYGVSSNAGKAGGTSPGKANTTVPSFAATVLAGHDVLMSLLALGSNAQLPQMAEELGAAVHTWRDVDQLRGFLKAAQKAHEEAQQASTSTSGGGSEGGQRQTVVLLDAEEVSPGLRGLVSGLRSSLKDVFVLPTWLSETYQQRRRLPLEAFLALPAKEPDQPEAKRQRLDEATYAWQPAEQKRLEELAEHSRTQQLQSKALQKMTEGMRLAELRQGPPR